MRGTPRSCLDACYDCAMAEESHDDYEYRGLIASSWDLLRGDTSGWPDRPFYRDAILRHGQPALDVGCGSGRLLLDYLASGLDVDGVDNSPEMLDICREMARRLGLRPRLYQQAMESLSLPRRYRTIFVPSSSFLLLADASQARTAMARFVKHLQPGGMLIMPFMILWKGDRANNDQAKEWRLVAEQARPEDGAIVRRWSRARFDVAQQLVHTEDRYEVIVDDEIVTTEHYSRSPETRWYTLDQALDLYREMGLSDVRAVSGFTAEPASPDDKIFTIFGTRP